MDQALDDIIKQQRGGQRGGRGRGRGRGGIGRRGSIGGGFGRRGGSFGNKARAIANFARPPLKAPSGQWQHDRYDDDYEENGTGTGGGGARFLRSADGGGANATTKLLISNLDFGVSDSDVKELFGEFGALKRAAVHYDKSGRSLGSAEVLFERKVDAVRAMKQYNNVPLDGRPMKIQLLGANSATAAGASSLGSRLGAAPGMRRGMRGGGRRGIGGGRGGRGRGGGGRGGQPKESLTAAQLDAELDAYVNKMDE